MEEKTFIGSPWGWCYNCPALSELNHELEHRQSGEPDDIIRIHADVLGDPTEFADERIEELEQTMHYLRSFCTRSLRAVVRTNVPGEGTYTSEVVSCGSRALFRPSLQHLQRHEATYTFVPSEQPTDDATDHSE